VSEAQRGQLPADVAEWMGMDEDMVPFVLSLADIREMDARAS
jgi:hypothetical protein